MKICEMCGTLYDGDNCPECGYEDNSDYPEEYREFIGEKHDRYKGR